MAVQSLSKVPESFRKCRVIDRAGEAKSIAELIHERVTLLLFMRHFGCIGCAEHVATLAPRFVELDQLGVRIVMIGCGPPRFIEPFIERQRLVGEPVEVFTDESLTVQRQAGLGYGHWGGFGPRGVFEQVRAFVRGHVSGDVEGDAKQQAGALLIDAQGIVRLYHQSRSLGDHVDHVRLVDAALSVCLNANPELI